MTAEKNHDEVLSDKEKELRKKYKHVVPGTIQKETDGPHANKLTVEVECSKRGCKSVRRVASSDLFQVKLCPDCVRDARLSRRRDKAKAARATKAERKAARSQKARKARKKATVAPEVKVPAEELVNA